jgi:hypothetical protein
MKKKRKYDPLRDHLALVKGDRYLITFKEIEETIQDNLPLSARKYQAYWSNHESHVIALAWIKTQWKKVHVDIEKEIIQFKRII